MSCCVSSDSVHSASVRGAHPWNKEAGSTRTVLRRAPFQASRRVSWQREMPLLLPPPPSFARRSEIASFCSASDFRRRLGDLPAPLKMLTTTISTCQEDTLYAAGLASGQFPVALPELHVPTGEKYLLPGLKASERRYALLQKTLLSRSGHCLRSGIDAKLAQGRTHMMVDRLA